MFLVHQWGRNIVEDHQKHTTEFKNEAAAVRATFSNWPPDAADPREAASDGEVARAEKGAPADK